MKTIDKEKRITYSISKGKHYSNGNKKEKRIFTNVQYFKFSTRLEKEHYYNREDVTHSGINKLFGFSNILHDEKIFGNIPIIRNLVNSFLVGWQPNYNTGNNMFIYAYYDVSGKEYIELVSDVTLPAVITMEAHRISKGEWEVNFSVSNNKEYKLFEYEFSFGTNINMGYLLNPYFGGKSTAPKDFIFDVNKTIQKV